MNRSIINPLLIIMFFGLFFLGLINLYLFKNASGSMIWLLIFPMAFYFFGVLLVTMFGNVPLNDLLDKMSLSEASFEELKLLQNRFETKWNHLHLIRTISFSISFLLLILKLLKKINN